MSKQQPKLKLPGSMPASNATPEVGACRRIEPLNQGLALERKRIELILKKWDIDFDDLLSEKSSKSPALEEAPSFFERSFDSKIMVGNCVDNSGPKSSPPQSPPSSPPPEVIASYDILASEISKLKIGGVHLSKTKVNFPELSEGQGHQDKNEISCSESMDQVNEQLKNMVIALKYQRPGEDAPELTPEMFGVLTQALEGSPPEECLSEFNGLKYSREDLTVLNNGTEWLNDRNIDFYLELIKERSITLDGYLKVYVFHCFFYVMLTDKDCSFAVLSDATGEEDLTKFDLVFFPVNLHDHWRLVVADFGEKKLKCYDSLGPHQEENEEILKEISSYLVREYLRRHGRKQEIFFGGWILENVATETIPQQGNEIDCGVFLLQFAEYLSRGQKHFDFEQKHVPYFRKKMMYETLMKRILPQQNVDENHNLRNNFGLADQNTVPSTSTSTSVATASSSFSTSSVCPDNLFKSAPSNILTAIKPQSLSKESPASRYYLRPKGNYPKFHTG